MRGRGPAEDTRKTFIRYITGKRKDNGEKKETLGAMGKRRWGRGGGETGMKYGFLTSAFIPEDDRKI